MKKLFVYLTMSILLCSIQACNNNSASNSTATDSTTNANTYNDSTVNQNDTANIDTSEKKNAIRIDATEIPDAVTTAFNSKYPNIADVKWLKADKKGKTLYKARWQANGKKMMATFADDGTFIKEKQKD
jgi:hypothetical protein